MAMTGRNTMGGETPRREFDRYVTPDALAAAIVKATGDAYGLFDHVIEPSAGPGPFVRAARARWLRATVLAVEPFDPASEPVAEGSIITPLHDAGADRVYRQRWEDFGGALLGGGKYGEGLGRVLTIANPPFTDGEAHIRLALERSREDDIVVALLRASILAGAARVRGFWKAWPPDRVWHLAPRPSFTGGGTDGSEYVAIAWRAQPTAGGYRGAWLDWKPPAAT